LRQTALEGKQNEVGTGGRTPNLFEPGSKRENFTVRSAMLSCAGDFLIGKEFRESESRTSCSRRR